LFLAASPIGVRPLFLAGRSTGVRPSVFFFP
jgi:hypothetical protein